MVTIDLQDVLRTLFGSYRIQLTRMSRDASSADLSALDYRFRAQLYENYDYTAMAADVIGLLIPDNVIDYRDDFGLHYMVFRNPESEGGDYLFCGPFLYRSYGREDFRRLLLDHHLEEEALGAIEWYFKRVPVIHDSLGWRQMLSVFLSRYLANPDLDIRSVRYDRPEEAKRKPMVALSSISYDSVEARYAVEEAMLAAIRRGDIAEATYQQNLFMGFSLDARDPDPLRDAKNMIIAVNTAYRKTIQQASVHPMYIDAISGQFQREIEAAKTLAEATALIPKMIRHYCLLVKRHSLEQYSSLARDCINFINFHYMEPLSLEVMAERFAVNKNYLSSRFHQEVGMTVTAYINRTRVERSIAMLEKTSLTIQEVAERCGFSDGNYFTRIFRKLNGMTPNEYRISLKRRL